MKKLSLVFFALTSLLQLKADNWLYNGDFTDGASHWRGNGSCPADYAQANPLDKPDPFLSKGLIIELKDKDWRKIQQDFKGKLANGVMTITYMVSSDFTFSNKPEDYTMVPYHIDYQAWKPFDIPVGNWMVFISDFGANHGVYYEIKPKLGSSDPQTIKFSVHGLTPYADKTIALAFPPGTGKLVLLNVSIDNE